MRKKVLQAVKTVSLCIMLVIGGIGAIFALMGHGAFLRLLQRFGLPHGFTILWGVGIMALIVHITAYRMEMHTKDPR